MANKVTKLFKLRTNSDHYIEFQVGLNSFRFEFAWNGMEQRYAVTIYKNLELKINSYFLVWSLNNLLDAFSYMDLGNLHCVSEEGYTDENGLYRYKEISKENIQEVIFRWDYEVI